MKVKISRIYESDGYHVAVSRESPFYPDGKGGQLGDRGRIGGVTVLRVVEKKGEIHHFLKDPIGVGEHEVEIDLERRKEIARQHTAQHVLSASFMKVADLETVSFHMGEEYSTIDLDASSVLDEVLEEAEELANEIILENRPVLEHIVDRDRAGDFPLRKPISERIRGKVRIVEIQGFDWSACGGFHVSSTGEIGMVKIVDREKVKGKLTRVYFVAGFRALRDYGKRVKILKELSRKLTASPEEMISRVENMDSEIRRLRKRIEEIAKYVADDLVDRLMKNARRVGDVDLVIYDGPEELLKTVFKGVVDRDRTLLVSVIERGYELASNHIDVGRLIGSLKEKLGGRGGGGRNRGRIFVDVKLEDFVEELEKAIPEVV